MTEDNGEQTATEEKKEMESEDTTEDSNDGIPNKDGLSLIDDARKAAEELKKQNEIKLQLLTEEKKLIERREALMQLGGDSLVNKKPSKKEETPQEYAARLMRGEL